MNSQNTALQLFQPMLPMGSLEAYLQRVNDISMLTPEEELSLATRFQEQGDLQAAQRLVLAHLRYVARVARGYLGYGLPLGDLIQEGTVGLMKAVKRFDPKMGVRLVSFAVHWIKAEIHEFVLKNWRIVKVATTKAQRKLFFNLRSAKKRLGWATSEEVDAVARDLGVAASEVRRMEERLNARDMQFDAPVREDGSDNTSLVPAEFLEDAQANPLTQLERLNSEGDTEKRLRVAMARLDARSQDIVAQRWLQEDTKATLHDLAARYNVSPERIRQLEKNAMLKLRVAMEEESIAA